MTVRSISYKPLHTGARVATSRVAAQLSTWGGHCTLINIYKVHGEHYKKVVLYYYRTLQAPTTTLMASITHHHMYVG